MRQLTKVFRNARSWHGSQLFIEEEDRVCLGLRLGMRKRRNGGLDCCCHRNPSLLVDKGRQNRVRHMRHTYQRDTSDDIKKFLHAYSPMRSADWELQRRLNQDRTAIYHN